MKRSKAGKLLAWLLSVSMVVSAMFTGTAPGLSAAEDSGEEVTYYARTINLGTKGISHPRVPTGSKQEWRGDYVYFGLGGGVTLHNRVLDPSTTEFGTDESTMLFENSYVIEDMTLHSEGFKDWGEASTYLNGEFMDTHFSAGERTAIAKSSKAKESEQDGSGYAGLRFVPFSDVSLFLLDAKEVTRLSYGYYDKKNNPAVSRVKKKKGEPASWWLRSECEVEYVDSDEKNHYQGGVVKADGSIACIADHPEDKEFTQGISPAFNVKSSAVVFTSMFSESEAGEGDTLSGKPFGVISGEKTLEEVRDYDTVDNVGHNWKLTLKSGDKAPEISDIERDGNQISFDYSGVRTGERQTLSAIITSGEGDEEIILHYGILEETDRTRSQSGTVTFTLPAGFDRETHHLKVFSEQRNGAATTDYAGEMAVVDVPDPTGTPVQTLKPTKRPDVETGAVTTARPSGTPTATPKPGETDKPSPRPGETDQPTMRPEETESPAERNADEETGIIRSSDREAGADAGIGADDRSDRDKQSYCGPYGESDRRI